MLNYPELHTYLVFKIIPKMIFEMIDGIEKIVVNKNAIIKMKQGLCQYCIYCL